MQRIGHPAGHRPLWKAESRQIVINYLLERPGDVNPRGFRRSGSFNTIFYLGCQNLMSLKCERISSKVLTKNRFTSSGDPDISIQVGPPRTRSRTSSDVLYEKETQEQFRESARKKEIYIGGRFAFAGDGPPFGPAQNQPRGRGCPEGLPTFDPIFFSMSRTRTFCWMYMSSGDFPGASSRFIPPSPVALRQHTNTTHTVTL